MYDARRAFTNKEGFLLVCFLGVFFGVREEAQQQPGNPGIIYIRDLLGGAGVAALLYSFIQLQQVTCAAAFFCLLQHPSVLPPPYFFLLFTSSSLPAFILFSSLYLISIISPFVYCMYHPDFLFSSR